MSVYSHNNFCMCVFVCVCVGGGGVYTRVTSYLNYLSIARSSANLIRFEAHREMLNLADLQFTVHAVKVLFHCTVVLR